MRWVRRLGKRPDQNAVGAQVLVDRRFGSEPPDADMATRRLSKLFLPTVCKRTEKPETSITFSIAGHRDGKINLVLGRPSGPWWFAEQTDFGDRMRFLGPFGDRRQFVCG